MQPPIPTTPEGPPEIPHNALVAQKYGQAVMIWAIGAFCIFGWEWLLCLRKEYKRIWIQPINASSVLYIANRYFGLIQLTFVVTLVSNIWSPSACKHVFFFEPAGALISTILSQMILGSRVYAIFSQNKVVGFILGATIMVEIIINGIAVSTTSPPPAAPQAGPPGSQPPCGAVIGPPGWLVAFWTIPLFYDALTFLLTAWKAYTFWKSSFDAPLFNIIRRDGTLYFFAIFSMNVINVTIFLTVPKALRPVNLTPTIVLEIVLSCRMVLNLREAHSLSASQASQARWGNTSRTPYHTSNIVSGEEYIVPFETSGMKLEPLRNGYEVEVKRLNA